MMSRGSRAIRRKSVRIALALGACLVVAGCGGEADDKPAVAKDNPEVQKQVDDMTKFYESNPPGAATK